MRDLTIGIDLGGTTITAGLVDERGELLCQETCDTALPCPAEQVEQRMARLCGALLGRAGADRQELRGVGIGTPGSVDSARGTVGLNPNFGYEHWALGPHMEALLGCPVKIENDANAAAYGEYCRGAARGRRSAVIVTLGTGIGGGVILDGRLYTGCNGAGAELGHMVICRDGLLCTCGRHGCWERYASARALTAQGAAAMETHPDSALWRLARSPRALNARHIFDALGQGDALAKQLFDAWMGYVCCGMVNLINIFQPEVLCVGGGVSRQGEVLLGPIRRAARQEEFARNLGTHTEIRACVLYNEAGLIGAACLARNDR